mgnify:CR=1 FL=1
MGGVDEVATEQHRAQLKSKEAFLHFLFGTSARILANHRKMKRPEYVDQLIAKYEHINHENTLIEQQFEKSAVDQLL